LRLIGEGGRGAERAGRERERERERGGGVVERAGAREGKLQPLLHHLRERRRPVGGPLVRRGEGATPESIQAGMKRRGKGQRERPF
jgi:hypothetical protein